ncbi:uncharacterized protein [Venturia canescens]|uniref:uncharacterized protein n=1 Tax=Venturia canescens TaxID=32260 RepID=UPI001C9C9641|nr:uncharacterized protein LOC122416932 [Venturia canescens]
MTTNSSRLVSVATVLVILAAIVKQGEAIICYQCNSAFDPRCGDPFDPYSLGTVNCSFQPRLEHLGHLEPTLCRKIAQKVYGKLRVVRGCGYISEARDNGLCVRRTGTHDVMAHYCACTGDLCNGAIGKLPSSVTTAIFPMILLLLKI